MQLLFHCYFAVRKSLDFYLDVSASEPLNRLSIARVESYVPGTKI